MTTGKKKKAVDLQFGSGALEYCSVGEYGRLKVEERSAQKLSAITKTNQNSIRP